MPETIDGRNYFIKQITKSLLHHNLPESEGCICANTGILLFALKRLAKVADRVINPPQGFAAPCGTLIRLRTSTRVGVVAETLLKQFQGSTNQRLLARLAERFRLDPHVLSL